MEQWGSYFDRQTDAHGTHGLICGFFLRVATSNSLYGILSPQKKNDAVWPNETTLGDGKRSHPIKFPTRGMGKDGFPRRGIQKMLSLIDNIGRISSAETPIPPFILAKSVGVSPSGYAETCQHKEWPDNCLCFQNTTAWVASKLRTLKSSGVSWDSAHSTFKKGTNWEGGSIHPIWDTHIPVLVCEILKS